MKNLLIILLLCLVLLSCTAGRNDLKNKPDKDGDVAGFFLGFWHGLISVITLILSIFIKNISIYEVHNIGFLYNLGFLLGAGVLTGGTLWSKKRK